MISRSHQGQALSLEVSSLNEVRPTAVQLPAGKQAMCLVCGNAYPRRADMIRHACLHIALLSQNFSCPICRHITSSPSEFSNHVEQMHGKQYAPHFATGTSLTNVPANPEPTPKIPCAVCRRDVGAGSILHHYNSQHAGDLRPKEESLTCTACPDKCQLNIKT